MKYCILYLFFPQYYCRKMDSPLRTPRDERRRAQHNEVERRRRDKINNWIVALSKIIPDCSIDGTKIGGVSCMIVKVGSCQRRVITLAKCRWTMSCSDSRYA
uniref:BHLH domain-containing protein n=1 Tax=Sinocyclocheilus rhinocerous TaxID=307959 RepID=A0A673HDZ3_9TELE